jgi:hypothetical protein
MRAGASRPSGTRDLGGVRCAGMETMLGAGLLVRGNIRGLPHAPLVSVARSKESDLGGQMQAFRLVERERTTRLDSRPSAWETYVEGPARLARRGVNDADLASGDRAGGTRGVAAGDT